MRILSLRPDLAGKFRVSRLFVLAPFFLAGCLFDEISQEKTELVFEESGAVQYRFQAEGTLNRELQSMSEAERDEAVAGFRERVLVEGSEIFGDGYIGSSVTPLSATEASGRLEGRFLPDTQGVDVQLPPLRVERIGLHAWEVKVTARDVGDHPTTLCITLESGWDVLQQPATLPAVTVGRENCIDLRNIRRNDSVQIIRLNTDGRPADGRPDVSMAEADIYAWFENNVSFLDVLHMELTVGDRSDLPADVEIFTFSAFLAANEQLYAFVEEIEAVRILRESARPRETTTLRGRFEWQLDDKEWKIRLSRIENVDEANAFGYSRAHFESNGKQSVIEGSLEAEMLRARQLAD